MAIVTIIIGLLCIGNLEDKYEKKIKTDIENKRKYKFQYGLWLLVLAIISAMLAIITKKYVLIYSVIVLLYGIYKILGAINTNVGDIFSSIIMSGLILFILNACFGEHQLFIKIASIWFGVAVLCSIIEGISNMIKGIDPEIEKIQKEIFKDKIRVIIKPIKMVYKIGKKL